MIHDISMALDGLQPFAYSSDDEIVLVFSQDEDKDDFQPLISDQDIAQIRALNRALDYFH